MAKHEYSNEAPVGACAVPDGDLKSSYRTRIGAGVATVSLFTASTTVLFLHIPLLRQHLMETMILPVILALVLVLLGRRGQNIQVDEDRILRFYIDPRYWGTSLLIATVLTIGLVVLLAPKPVAAKVVVAQPTPPPPAPEPEVKPPVFPFLDVSAVVLNGTKSSAVIDRKTVQVGERINGVQLVDVFEDGVVVELQGYRKRVLLNLFQPLVQEQASPKEPTHR